MTSRIRDNRMKALIYLLIFVMLTFKSIVSEPSTEETAAPQQTDAITAPVWAR